ncbi:MAG: translocation/assembly module TamB domain-containing protein [Thiohalocapsa sp.]|uniref:translocation/assembly module TamB domain-containing protein n=1 Tax=Thiohalocapsa sp. TaxID=2497641 RepID=UPI0025D7CC07|nr:translocation/assembly module TamB domain-containing protein [Thiohalocapsa sp.]MCG6943632.1 translocation/assembly module TamB domain-containing protein [Thiohalocapsa sp.]
MPRRNAGKSSIGWKLLRLLLRVVGVVLLLVVLLLGFVLGTQTGLRAAVGLAEELAPQMITVGQVDGRVLGELTLGDVMLELPGLSVRVGHLHLDWQPGALLIGRLHIDDLTVADVDVVSTPKAKKEPFELPKQIRLPIEVDIQRLLVERLSIREKGAPENTAILLTRAELSATAESDRVDLRRLSAQLAQPEASATAAGKAQLTGDYPVDLKLDWRFRRPPALELSGAGSIGGTLAALDIHNRVEGAVVLTLDATVHDVLSAPSWRADMHLERLDLPAIVPDAPAVNVTARLDSSGDLNKGSVTGSLSGDAPDLPDVGKLSAKLDLAWAEQRLTLNTVRVDETGSGAMLDLTGHADLSGPTPAFDIHGAWERLRWPLAGKALVEAPLGKLDVVGDLDAFGYTLNAELYGANIPEARIDLSGNGSTKATRVDRLLVETLGGRIEAKGSAAWSPAVTWDIAVTAADIDPGLQVPGLDGKVALKADSRGGLEQGYGFDANIVTQLKAYPDAVMNLAGKGDLKQVQVDTLTVETLGGVIDGGGKLAWSPTPVWDLALTANDLDPGRQYPGLDGQVGFKLTSTGGLKQGFDFKVQGSAAVGDYPPAVVDIGGKGDAKAVQLEKLQIKALKGRIDGTGRVAWAPALSWDAALTLKDLDPGSLLAEWPGSIGGQVQSQGRMTDQGPDLSARISDVSGKLRGYPVRLDAALSMQGKNIRVENLTAGSGSTRLTADGSLADQQLDFRFDFTSPDLAALVPGGAGSLDANGKVGGTLAAPRVRLSFKGRDAEVSGQGIAAIDGSVDVGLGAGGDFNIDITGSNLVAGGQRFETLSVQGRGRMDSHSLKATLGGEALGVKLAVNGGLSPSFDYKGSLGELTLTTQTLGTWSLQRLAPLDYAGGAAKVGPLCLGNGAGSGACVGFEQPQAGRFEVSLNADRIDFNILNPLLPELLVMKGYVRADGRFRGEGNQLTGSARVEVPTGEVVLSLNDENKDKLTFSGTRLDVRAGANALDASFNLPLARVGGAQAEVTLPGFRLNSGSSQALRGNLRLNLSELSVISNLFPDIDNVTGNIEGDVRLAGTLGAPNLGGQLQARNLGLRLPLYGTTVSNGSLTATSRGASGFDLTGGANVGGGRLDLNGTVDLAGAKPAAQVSVRGKKLKVADSSEYFALLSLDMNVGVGPGGTAVRGQIDVPEARIKPRTVPAGAVEPSPDVVVETQSQQKQPLPLSIDVLAKLGEKVSIDAFGLRGLLRGQLRITKAPRGDQILGDGQLKIVDGTYRVTLPTLGVLTAIGKPLTIEQGVVVFAKTPISNPGLILNAQREGGDVTAGVRVLGTLRHPKLAFFSESNPELTQSQVTQYLITGIPPTRNAAADKRALAVGTYITPKIYMEYEGATSDANETIKMRYDLSNRIELQAETGGTQGADIFFKFEN